MAEKIPSSEIEKRIAPLAGWHKVENRDAITKNFKFNDFVGAFAFMSACADYAEEINHHPEWFNVYNRVDVTLNTHDVDGLSDLDLKMAQRMNTIANT